MADTVVIVYVTIGSLKSLFFFSGVLRVMSSATPFLRFYLFVSLFSPRPRHATRKVRGSAKEVLLLTVY